jgi:hypothetical protein
MLGAKCHPKTVHAHMGKYLLNIAMPISMDRARAINRRMRGSFIE